MTIFQKLHTLYKAKRFKSFLLSMLRRIFKYKSNTPPLLLEIVSKGKGIEIGGPSSIMIFLKDTGYIMKENLRNFIIKLYHPKGKWAFIHKHGNHAKILDVGCGNQSPSITKSISPTCKYTGLDIGEYNITESDRNASDDYIFVSPENFSSKIAQFDKVFDIVISAHNLEHTNNRQATLIAILHSVKKGGKIYLSFPAKGTVSFPSRQGTLNYYDDPTHKDSPPNFQEIVTILKENNFDINFAQEQYQPKMLYIIGTILEPISKFTKKNMLGTWAYYGFESVIHATRL